MLNTRKLWKYIIFCMLYSVYFKHFFFFYKLSSPLTAKHQHCCRHCHRPPTTQHQHLNTGKTFVIMCNILRCLHKMGRGEKKSQTLRAIIKMPSNKISYSRKKRSAQCTMHSAAQPAKHMSYIFPSHIHTILAQIQK